MRRILHIDMDCFFVSVERAIFPELVGKPVVVAGSPEKRGVVSSASYEARAYGIKAGMPVKKAKELCPFAIFLPVRGEIYEEYSRKVFQILANYSPLVEPASIDEAYMDITGTERLFGPPIVLASKLQMEIAKKLGLFCSIGIASTKILAKIGSKLAKPKGILEIKDGQEQTLLSNLDLCMMPGIGESTARILSSIGAKKIGDLVKIGERPLKKVLGKRGEELYKLANGEDDSSVETEEYSHKSIAKEITFETDLFDLREIKNWLFELSSELGFRLRKKRLFATRLSVKFRSPDFSTWTRSSRLPFPTNQDREIFSFAQKIVLAELNPIRTLRLLGISLSGLISYPGQMPLFERERVLKQEKLYQALDHLHNKYGFEILHFGSKLLQLIN